MKRINLLLALLLVSAMLFTACAESTAEETEGVQTSDTPDSSSEGEGEAEISTITVAEALELCGEEGNITEERYYIRATVKTVVNAQYGQMIIEDATGSISVYGTYSADGSVSYGEMDEKPYKGDEVLLYCILQNYNGEKEVKNAQLIEFRRAEVNFDPSEYTNASVSEARDAESGKKLTVEGTVACIVYAFGMKPCGFYLVDGTNSIYVYDADTAQRVAVGNTVKLAASKTYWVLDSEKDSADKFGYRGACQLEDVSLISNDGKTSDSNKSWIPESTVKEMLEIPFTENATTTIFKVNALVSRVEGSGFVNYYFNDIDGETGSYVYTQCSGSDFEWLDKFDGKICTVYLSMINAKSSQSGCIYRFLPVSVSDDGYVFDTAEAGKYAVEYVGLDQFLGSYTGDPELSLIESVSSELLGFENASLSYKSSDESVIRFTKKDNVLVMNCVGNGKATVTVTGKYGSEEYSRDIEISVSGADIVDSVTVSEAIGAEIGEEVTVGGIVGPSLVNKVGFYLIDESGVIAVLTDAETMKTIKIGQKIALKGVRHNNTKGGAGYFGQTCIKDATVVSNSYGDHEYSTATFITDKTLADFYALDVKEDHSTNVFVLKATVELVETPYYTNIELKDGDTSVSLYCSSANQYSWLKPFAGVEITMELAACNWNDKAFYRGCVLSVITEDGKIYNELNFNG